MTARREHVHELSPRELEVLELVAEGLSNAEIGQRLNIAERTVRTHMLLVMAKLHANNRTHALIIALQCGILEPSNLFGTVPPGEMNAARALRIAEHYLHWAQKLMEKEPAE